MPIIVDINMAARIFKCPTEDYKPIYQLLVSGKSKLAYGGKVAKEYSKDIEVMRAVALLDRSGNAIRFSEKSMEDEITTVEKTNLCQSNDQHIIALARLSKARLLCTQDQPLQADFTNKSLIDQPRGKIYQNAGHIHLLKYLKC